jgi:Peptidase A4 family
LSRRRWLIPLAALAVAVAPALGATSASASTHSSKTLAVQPGGQAVHVIKPATGVLGARSGLLNEVASTNWSGYAASGGTYTSVSASWVQPAGSCTSTTSYSSFWVGLDGYSSKTVEQDGTDTDCVNGQPEYYGWSETYPNPAENFGQTVEPGDTMSASVVYQGSNRFQLNLADATEGWTATTTATVSGAARSSAEVIIEAPSSASTGDVLPLTDFGTVNLSDSLVDGSPIGSLSPTQIYMTNSAGQTIDTVSSLSDEENFSATWVSPAPVPVLSHGKAVATSPTRETVTWKQTIPSWEEFRIVGPGAINGHIGWVPPGTTTAYYSGLEAHHGYTVTYTPYTAENGSPITGAKPGSVYFVS